MRTSLMRTWFLASALAAASVGTALAQEPSNGAFSKWCQPCHSAGPGATIKLGPPLNGLDGRQAGTFPGFSYSDSVKNSGITWGEAVFKEYITNPMQKIPGTRMAFAGVRDTKEQDELWSYLKQFDAEGNKK
jgi:cytochrome c